MPVIRDYQRQTQAAGPTQGPTFTPDQFGAASGRALQNLGQAAGRAVAGVERAIDQKNTSDITVKLTKANADLAIDLQNTVRTAEPGDKAAFEDYDKRVEETLAKVGEDASSPTARRMFAENSERIKGQLYRHSAESQADLAGVKAVSDYQSSLNNLSSAALADPSSLQLQRDLHNSAVDSLVQSSQLPSDKALQLKQQGEQALVKSSIRGWAKLNPEYAKQKLNSGEFDSQLGSEGKLKLVGEIDQAIRADEIEKERRLKEQERLVKLQQQKTQNDLLVAMVDKSLTKDDILNSNLEAFGSGSKEQFLRMLKTANAPDERLKTDGSTMISLFNRIHLPDGDSNKLVDENELNQYFGNGLSATDLNRLRDEMMGKNTDEGRQEAFLKKQALNTVKGFLTKSNPLTGNRDIEGDENYLQFTTLFLDEYKKQRKDGVSALELLSPESPKYLGKLANQFKKSPQEVMRQRVNAFRQKQELGLSGLDRANAIAPVQPVRKKNESAAEYLEKIKLEKIKKLKGGN